MSLPEEYSYLPFFENKVVVNIQGYVNASQLCFLDPLKTFVMWKRSQGGMALIRAFDLKTGEVAYFQVKSKNKAVVGTYIHKNLLWSFIMWLCPSFALELNVYINENLNYTKLYEKLWLHNEKQSYFSRQIVSQ